MKSLQMEGLGANHFMLINFAKHMVIVKAVKTGGE
jgi:hypothetical protein